MDASKDNLPGREGRRSSCFPCRTSPDGHFEASSYHNIHAVVRLRRLSLFEENLSYHEYGDLYTAHSICLIRFQAHIDTSAGQFHAFLLVQQLQDGV
eukprot:750129-Hanusia_phi.AAC.1